MQKELSDIDIPSWQHYHLLRKQNALLMAAGFEPAEDDLWRKEGVWYGRGAALQNLPPSAMLQGFEDSPT